jgi:hypothetical protein
VALAFPDPLAQALTSKAAALQEPVSRRGHPPVGIMEIDYPHLRLRRCRACAKRRVLGSMCTYHTRVEAITVLRLKIPRPQVHSRLVSALRKLREDCFPGLR